MWIREVISVLLTCSITTSFVIPQSDTSSQPDWTWMNFSTISPPLSTSDVNLSNDNVVVDDVDLGLDVTQSSVSVIPENSTVLTVTGDPVLEIPQGALLVDQGEAIATEHKTTGLIGQQLQLTDMSKVKSSSDFTRKLLTSTTTTTPFIATPLPELDTTTMSETEILLRKLADEILMKLFEKFILKAAAAKSPPEVGVQQKTASRVARIQTAEPPTTVVQQPSLVRRRLFYGGLSEYEGLEESGYYRRELDGEFVGSF